MSSFDEVVDFVVVGSGGGSMCSVLVMREAGKSVLILEKTKYVGGTTARSGGAMWIPNNRFMIRDGVKDSREQALTYLDGLNGNDTTAPGAARERRLKYVDEAPRMIDFLVANGIRLTRTDFWPDYYDERPGGSKHSRSVFSEPFDLNELGPWKDKLRPGMLQMPATLGEMVELPHFRKSWAAKFLMLRIGLRGLAARLTRKKFTSAGAALQGQMLKAALDAGVDIRTEAPVRELIVDNGRVTGVLTEKDGKPWRVGANLGVLVNAGGFARNQTMRDKYQPGTSVDWTCVIESDTGEMIQEMMRHGAAIAQMEEFVGYPMTPAPGYKAMDIKPGMQGVTAKPHAILVDQSGVRYMNEASSYMAYCRGMLDRNKTVPALPSWAIFDEQYLKNYMFANTMPGPGSKKPQSWTDEGYLKKADTIEELAKSIKVDPAVLRGTIDRFNGFAARGVDEDFRRGGRAYAKWLGDPFFDGPSPSLGRIDQGPFYAVEVLPGDVGTFGGVVTDVHGCVLREDGSVIRGLYATGVSTASVMGRTYPGGGSSVGPSMTWGFISARHAAQLG